MIGWNCDRLSILCCDWLEGYSGSCCLSLSSYFGVLFMTLIRPVHLLPPGATTAILHLKPEHDRGVDGWKWLFKSSLTFLPEQIHTDTPSTDIIWNRIKHFDIFIENHQRELVNQFLFVNGAILLWILFTITRQTDPALHWATRAVITKILLRYC